MVEIMDGCKELIESAENMQTATKCKGLQLEILASVWCICFITLLFHNEKLVSLNKLNLFSNHMYKKG